MIERNGGEHGFAATEYAILCLRSRWDAGALDTLRTGGTDPGFAWDAFTAKVSEWGLAPLLYQSLRDQGVLPGAVEQSMRAVYEANALRNTILLYELEEVARLLVAEGIRPIVLKGAALAEAVYGNAAVRPMSDLDLLVPPAGAPQVLDVLLRAGYGTVGMEPHQGDAFAFESELMVRKPGLLGVPIEIHWSLVDSPYYRESLGSEWFWESALPLPVGSAACLMLGPEAQILHLCAHLMFHHKGEGLLWLHDIAEVIVFYRSQIDWDEVLRRAQEYRLVRPLQHLLPRVARAWGAPVPAATLERLLGLQATSEEAQVYGWLSSGYRPAGPRLLTDLRSMPRWGQRIRFAAGNLFPSPAYMRHRYRVSHPFPVPWLYPYRWWLGLCSFVSSVTGHGIAGARASHEGRHD